MLRLYSHLFSFIAMIVAESFPSSDDLRVFSTVEPVFVVFRTTLVWTLGVYRSSSLFMFPAEMDQTLFLSWKWCGPLETVEACVVHDVAFGNIDKMLREKLLIHTIDITFS